MDVRTKALYTGEKAKRMLGVPDLGIRNPYLDGKSWIVFVQSKCTGNRHLDKDTKVLYQFEGIASIDANTDSQDKNKMKREDTNLEKYLMELNQKEYRKMDVTNNCSLREYVQSNTNGYERGCAYYEFVHDEEDITAKNVILMDKDGKLHTGWGALKLIDPSESGYEVKRPSIPEYPGVFIQCKGPGYSVYLREGTSIIYKDPMIDFLVPVETSHYHEFEIEETCELRKFVDDKFPGRQFKRGSAFFQFTCANEDVSKDKVVLLKNKKTGQLFGGNAACHKIGAPGKGIPRPPDKFEYTVFIQNTSRGSRCLLEGTFLLYEKEQSEKADESTTL